MVVAVDLSHTTLESKKTASHNLMLGEQQSYARQIMSEVGRRHNLLLLLDPRFLILNVIVELPHLARLVQTRLSLIGQLQQFLIGSRQVQDTITHELWIARLIS